MKPLLFALLLLTAARTLGGDLQQRVGELMHRYTNSLAVVRDDTSAGSAFVAQYGKNKFLFTNQHVVAGKVNPTFTLANQTKLKVGTAAAAVEHDVVAYGMPSESDAMEVMTSVDQGTAVGDLVVVLGNPDGSGVIHPLTGRIVGIGPNLVEISAEIVPGCSGSPVVHLDSGKVIAIASYLRFEKADFQKGKMVDQVRRFCYRLDSIKKWEPVRWGDYNDESETVAKVRRRTTEICYLLLGVKTLRTLDPNTIQDEELRAYLRKYQQAMIGAKTIPERAVVIGTMVKDLRQAASVDIDHARKRVSYDYFTKMLAFEETMRQPFPLVLTRILEVLPQIEAELTAQGARLR